MKKYIILLPVLLGISMLNAQPDTRHARYYSAFQANSLVQMKAIIQEMEAEYQKAPSPEATLALAQAKYGAVGACFAHQDEDNARQLLAEAAKSTKKLLKENASAEAHALYAGILGMKIAISPAKGPFLGPQASRHAATAMELAPDNPFVLLQFGNNLFYTPAAFGGSLQKAIQSFEAARQKYEAQNTENNWPYLQCLAMLGQAQQAGGQRDAARATYQKALAIAPNFRWIKDELMPALEQ